MKELQSVPFWVVNLPREKERRRFMEDQLERFGVTYEIVAAVDGQKLTEDDLSSYSSRLALEHLKRELTLGEIGCALSHINLWERILREDIPEAIILEDDTRLGKAFFEVLENRDKFPQGYELINFGTEAATKPFGDYVADIYRCANYSDQAYMASAYLLTYEGARKLVNLVRPFYMPIDDFMSVAGLNSYGIYPKVVVQASFKTNIGPRHRVPTAPGFWERKYSEFKDILKACAVFLGFSQQHLTTAHLKLQQIRGKRKS